VVVSCLGPELPGFFDGIKWLKMAHL